MPGVDWRMIMSKSPYIELQALCVDHNIYQLVNFATRVANSGTSNLLDLILSNSPEKVLNIRPSQDFVYSDHTAISFELSANDCPMTERTSLVLDFKRGDFTKINQHMSSVDWTYHFSYLSSVQDNYRSHLQSVVFKGSLLTSDKDMADVFIKVFGEHMKSTGEIVQSTNQNRFRSKSIDFPPYAVCAILEKLQPKIGFSGDFINFFVLKKSAVSVALPLSIIFTEVYNECIFPSDWKSSITIPIHKRGRINDPENYRPIALTSPICRTLEKIIASYIRMNFHGKFISNQHGFISKRSCITALLSSITKWKSMLDNGNTIDVSSGVLQGTVTGPLLFLIYINDVLKEVDDEVEATVFADDVKISSSNPEKLQLTLNRILAWSAKWDMPIAPSKTSVLYLGKKNKRQKYWINGIEIPSVPFVKDLGIFIDEKLNFNHHVNVTVQKALAKCREILRSFCFKEIRPYMLIYKTYVAPIIDYGCCVYRPFITKKLEMLLERPIRSFSSPRSPLKIKLIDKGFSKSFFSFILAHWNSLATILNCDIDLPKFKSIIRSLPNSYFLSTRL
ncbi:unnamed protein product [Caenorhabditis angaria]|uniref:Reverse transcriptase domain-containing protein n=1 Tax=Caenorhabditis angaria TaxID=860376 RepID=A0A9P1NCH3_9PELO|nr:unnamed protein product [Caenorhabditis angaria]